jgi:hypothetical protein
VILKPCSEAIRSVRGDARLAGPELASDPHFLSKMLARAKDSLDIVTVHAYSDHATGIYKKLDSYRAAMRQNGVDASKEFWLTETGWSTPTPRGCWFSTVNDGTQAARTRDLLNGLVQNSLVKKVFFYELMDDDSPGACQWGLLRSNLSETPAYHAYRDFISAHSENDGGSVGSAPVPAGSYRQSCKDIVATSSSLTALCKNRKGVYKRDSLQNAGSCRKDIANVNGSLRCQ